jgi:hypothetical protein
MINVIDSKQLFLSSDGDQAEKLNGDMNSYIRYSLPRLVESKPGALYSSIRLNHAEIPYSFFLVNQYNNTLAFRAGTSAYSRTIEQGNYDSDTLITALHAAFLPAQISVSIDTLNGKLTFTSDSPFTVLGESTLGGILGFGTEGYDHVGIFDGTSYAVQPPYSLNLLGVRSISVKTNLIMDSFTSQSNEKSILKSIPVNVPPFGLIMYNNFEQTETLIKNKQVDSLEIQLVDDLGYPIDFQGTSWSIALDVRTVVQMPVFSHASLGDYLATAQE